MQIMKYFMQSDECCYIRGTIFFWPCCWSGHIYFVQRILPLEREANIPAEQKTVKIIKAAFTLLIKRG